MVPALSNPQSQKGHPCHISSVCRQEKLKKEEKGTKSQWAAKEQQSHIMPRIMG